MRHAPKIFCTILLAGFTATACSSSKAAKGGGKADLSTRVTHIDPVEQGFTGARVHVMLSVTNNGSSPVSITGAEVEARYADAPAVAKAADQSSAAEAGEGQPTEAETQEAVAASGAFRGSMQPQGSGEVAAGTSVQVPVEIMLEYPKEPEAFLAFVKEPMRKLRVTGTVMTSVGNVAIDDTTDFATPRLLEGKVRDAQMASIDEGAAGDVTLELVLNNPNPFAVKADAWKITVIVDGKELKSSDLAIGETVLPAAGVAYSEQFKIDEENWGPAYKDVLKKESIPYEVNGIITVGGVAYPSNVKGEMKFHR